MQALIRKTGCSMPWDIMKQVSLATEADIARNIFMSGMTLHIPVGQFIINQQVCLIILGFM
jgi:hypothetical protein